MASVDWHFLNGHRETFGDFGTEDEASEYARNTIVEFLEFHFKRYPVLPHCPLYWTRDLEGAWTLRPSRVRSYALAQATYRALGLKGGCCLTPRV